MKFTQQFKAARRVSTPLIAVQTFDARSSYDAIVKESLPGFEEQPILDWNAVNGLQPRNKAGVTALSVLDGEVIAASKVCAEALAAIATLKTEDVVVFAHNIHLQWSEPVVIQAIWNLRDQFKQKGSMLVLFTVPGATLPAELTNDVLTLSEPLPTVEELKATVADVFEGARNVHPKDSKEFKSFLVPNAADTEKIVDALTGLPRFSAEQSTAMCIEPKTGKIEVMDVWDRKKTLVSQTKGLSFYTGNADIKNIGGIESSRSFLDALFNGKDAPKLIIRLDEIEKAFAGTGTDSSGVKTELTGAVLSWMADKDIDGIVHVGVPGTCKSESIYAFGNSRNVPVINFDLAAMQDKHVGNSGLYLRQAQGTVDAISTGKVCAIATSNGLYNMPSELLSRFQLGTFFFDVPDAEERKSIWSIYIKMFGLNESVDKLNFNHNNWTGREIKSCCKKAYRLGWSLEQTSKYVVPVMTADAERMKTLRMSATGKFLSATKPGLYNMANADEMIAKTQTFEQNNASRKMRAA